MPEEFQRRAEAWRAKALTEFPYERIETTGAEALATWRKLKAEGRGVPVVIGDDDEVAQLAGGFAERKGDVAAMRSRDQIIAIVRQTLSMADQRRHPDDLRRQRQKEAAAAEAAVRGLARDPDSQLPGITIRNADGTSRVLSQQEILAEMMQDFEPPLGRWPSEEPGVTSDQDGLTVARDFRSGPLPKVSIALIPAIDATEIPAYLNLGGWNAMPTPDYHVAALRSWRDRYGAELVGLHGDTLNLRVTRPPSSREEALALAREQYDYCADIVDQGTGSLSTLAAILKVDRWWFFWWD